MKKTSYLPPSSLIDFPTPETGPAIVSDSPPVIGAFPTGRRVGGVVDIAVPVVLIVGGDGEVPFSQAVSEAVAMVRRCRVLLSETFNYEDSGEEFLSPVDCIPLANSDRLHVVPRPDTRGEFLALLSESVEKIRARMAKGMGAVTDEIDQAASEMHGIIDILRISPPSFESKAS